FRARYPKSVSDSDGVYKSVIRAKALDTLRGLLPAATTSNVGLFGTGQAFEALLLRMFAHPLAEVRGCAAQILAEVRQVIPAFPRPLGDDVAAEPRDEATLTDFDPEGELKVVAAALYSVTALPDDQLLAAARALSPSDRAALLAAYVGRRANRRHKPGRAAA